MEITLYILLNNKNLSVLNLPLTGGLAQAGVWLARIVVRTFNCVARPNFCEPPAFAKPLGR